MVMETKTPTATIVQQVLNTVQLNECPSGSYCYFIKLNKKWAVKLYSKKHERDEAYNNQRLAAEHHLAPDVGRGNIKVKRPDGEVMYGYITEIVKTVLNFPYNLNKTRTKEQYDHFNEMQEKMRARRIQLDCLYRNIGIYNLDDFHAGNLGYLEDGTIVCIDFY
jgi:hypothetical protein